jgi:uncharacterized repeat protein (TIGR01451 family)
MKRLLLRIGALGTVVVLGVIAIVQVQRGAANSPFAAASPAGGKAPSADGAPQPGLASANPGVNPPRALGGQPTATGVIATATPQSGRGRFDNATPPEQLMPRPSADPFVVHAAGAASPAAAGSRDVPIPVASNIPPDDPRAPTLPARGGNEDRRDPTLPGAEATGKKYPVADAPPLSDPRTADRYAPVAQGTERYPASPPAASDADEPAQLKADPFAMPTGLARQGAAAEGNSDRPAREQSGVFPPAAATAGERDTIPDASALEAAPAGEGTGKPGGKQLEGPQSPQLAIQKFAPEEIQVGKPATFRVVVHNTGAVAAGGVEVHDQIPKGTRVISTQPRASRGVHGELVWTLGTIKPGEEAVAEVQLMPLCEGEIGSVATVVFHAEASARSLATKPQLVLESSAPERVLAGAEVTLTITVSNPGSGVATGVVLEEHIPAGLQHPAGNNLEYEVGELRPGASRKLELTLLASRPGPVTNILTARSDGNLAAENRRNLEITAPQLDVALEGPKKRYLEREATYQLLVSNSGTAAAEQVELVACLPTGLKFISANNGGHYEEASRAVHWRLEELPANETGTVELVTMPVEAGQQAIKLLGTAQRGVKVEKEQPVLIDGLAAIVFQAIDTVDPVEVGGETTYEIHVVNQGSKAATNMRVAVLLPPELKPVAAEGPARHVMEGNRVVFDGLARLAPKADITYRVRAQGLKPGDLRTRIQLMTDELQSPVTKEESTRVYADE